MNSILLLINPKIYFLIFKGYPGVILGIEETKHSNSKLDKYNKDSIQMVDSIDYSN
jgi:hypothetical protein